MPQASRKVEEKKPLTNRLNNAQDNPSQHSAGNNANTAENCGNESLDARHHAHQRIDRVIIRYLPKHRRLLPKQNLKQKSWK